MTVNLETLVLPLKSEDNAFRAAISRATQLVGALVNVVKDAAVESVNLASDFAETVSKTNVVFEGSAKEIMEWGETASTAMGMSRNTALAAAATFGNLFRAMKIGEKPSADMSKGLVKLAADLASFNNMDPTEVLEKLRSGLSGEVEPLRTLGVNLNQALLEERALELGLWDGVDALDAAAKAQAAYSLILEQTSLAQGDFERTADGLANQQRILEAQWEDMKTELGAAFLPVVTKFFKQINDGIPLLKEFGAKLRGAFDAGGILEAAELLLGKFDEIDFGAVSTAIINGINSIDWSQVGMDLSALATRIEQSLTEALSEFDWMGVGNSLASMLNNVIAGALFGTDEAGLQVIVKTKLAEIQAEFDLWAQGVPSSLDALDVGMVTKVQSAMASLEAAITEKLRVAGASFANWATVSVPAALGSFEASVTNKIRSAMNSLEFAITEKIRDVSKALFNAGTKWANQAAQGFLGNARAIYGAIETIVGEINGILRKIRTSFNISFSFSTGVSSQVNNPSLGGNNNDLISQGVPPHLVDTIGGRASGGPAIAGQAYRVHENEVFTPSVSGRIDPLRASDQPQAVLIMNWDGLDYERLASEVIKAVNNT